MDASTQRALKVAEFLLSIKAVELNPGYPFTWASGMKSPIYCDNRRTLSFPEVRDYLAAEMTELVRRSYPSADVIAGVATGGIPLGVLVADRLRLPFVYIRSESKKHGLHNRVEGSVNPGQRAVVLEDLVSTGRSSLSAVDALRETGVEVLGMAAVFTYRMEPAAKSFAEANCPLVTLSDYPVLIEKAVETGYVSRDDLNTLIDWQLNPAEWSDRHSAPHHTPAP